jgi:transcriptional regulator with XRE-family HTH domain
MADFRTDVIELKKIMVENQYNTISALSEASGVDRVTLGQVVNGKKQPSAPVMYKLADALHMMPAQCGKVFFAQKNT